MTQQRPRILIAVLAVALTLPAVASADWQDKGGPHDNGPARSNGPAYNGKNPGNWHSNNPGNWTGSGTWRGNNPGSWTANGTWRGNNTGNWHSSYPGNWNGNGTWRGNNTGNWNGAGTWHGTVNAWRGGNWQHGWHNGRFGWWWAIPGDDWIAYDEPVYPYPDYPGPLAAPVPAGSYWYYCPNPPGYYPYVQQCAGPWMPVPPQGS